MRAGPPSNDHAIRVRGLSQAGGCCKAVLLLALLLLSLFCPLPFHALRGSLLVFVACAMDGRVWLESLLAGGFTGELAPASTPANADEQEGAHSPAPGREPDVESGERSAMGAPSGRRAQGGHRTRNRTASKRGATLPSGRQEKGQAEVKGEGKAGDGQRGLLATRANALDALPFTRTTTVAGVGSPEARATASKDQAAKRRHAASASHAVPQQLSSASPPPGQRQQRSPQLPSRWSPGTSTLHRRQEEGDGGQLEYHSEHDVDPATAAAVLEQLDRVWEPWADRATVADALENRPDGSFRVRPSRQNPDSRILCVKYGHIILHYLMERFDGAVGRTFVHGGVVLAGHSRVFRSIVDLIAFYSLRREALPCILRLHTDTHNDTATARASMHSRSSSEALILVDVPQGESYEHTPPSRSRITRTLHRLRFHRLRLPVPKRWLPSVSKRISSHIGKLVNSSRTTEGRTVESFVRCTVGAKETDYQAVLQNIRQFLDGMRNFILAQYGDAYRDWLSRSADTQDVAPGTLPSIIEMTLQNRVVPRLHHHAFKLIINHFRKQGDLQQFKQNMTALRRCEPEDIGLKPKLASIDWSLAIRHLEGMQASTSPVHKLQELLFFVDTVHDILDEKKEVHGMEAVGADEMLPLIVHILLTSRITLFEAEAEYMWGLLDPALLNGEGGYYLTTLSSAIHVIKAFNLQTHPRLRAPSVDDMQGFLRVYFVSKHIDVVFKTLAVNRDITAEDICHLISRRFHLPQSGRESYALYEVTEHGESRLDPDAKPQLIKMSWPLDRRPGSYRIEFRHDEPEVSW